MPIKSDTIEKVVHFKNGVTVWRMRTKIYEQRTSDLIAVDKLNDRIASYKSQNSTNNQLSIKLAQSILLLQEKNQRNLDSVSLVMNEKDKIVDKKTKKLKNRNKLIFPYLTTLSLIGVAAIAERIISAIR